MSIEPTRRVILVTGALAPAGGAIAARLARGGNLVIAAEPSGDALLDDAAVRSMIDGVVAQHGRLDVLINAAGDAAEPRHGFDLTVHAARLCSEHAARHLAASDGAIVHVSVLGGDDPLTEMAHAALEALTRRQAAAHAGRIRINAVLGAHKTLPAMVEMFAGEDAPSGQVMRLERSAQPAPSPTATTSPAPATGSTPTIEASAPRRTEPAADGAVAVVGMGVAVPHASSPEALWRLLTSDRPVFGEPATSRLDLATIWSPDLSAEDRTYARVAGFMTGFEPHPRLAADPVLAAGEFTAAWLRHSLLQALDGVTVRATDRHLFAVGLTPDGSQHLEHSLVVAAMDDLLRRRGLSVRAALEALYPLGARSTEAMLPYRIARMAASDLPPDAEIVVVDTACSSSLYTIDVGVRALRAGDADVALCGGAFALNAQSLVLFAKLRGLSRAGVVRSLDRGADGVLFSDGAAVLALKRHARAVADGDPILGFVEGFGGSSDGRGKAIYAPNAAGQRIALQRAWQDAGVAPGDIDWILAHATGTPTGDRTELAALNESSAGKTWLVTSNKSLVGHSGWAAGAVSAVHALLALRHQTIPGQRRFTALPDGIGPTVQVPTEDTAWRKDAARPRRVGISAMGFGGTNGHLILSDTRPTRLAKPAIDDPVVIVAWGAHLPGTPSADRVERWLATGVADWPASFGATYPTPSPIEARLAPSALAAMDRTQLMAIRCADLIAGDWTKDRALAARTGVFVGHSGPTRSAVGYDLRCYQGDLVAKLAGVDPTLDAATLTEAARSLVRPANEDSYPGLMPNIIAARVVQRLDLHGPNMTIDAGLDSVGSAIATAARYLRDGEIDLAIVMGVNATTELVEHRDGREPAEAALGLVVTRAGVARDHGLPVLAQLALRAGSTSPARPTAGDRTYRGAEGAVAILQAIHAGQVAAIAPREDGHTPTMIVTPAAALHQAAPAAEAGSTARPASAVPGAHGDPALDQVLARHALVLRPEGPRAIRPAVAAFPPGCLIITDVPDLVRTAALDPRCVVISSVASSAATHAARAEALGEALGGRTFAQVRVVVGPQRGAPTELDHLRGALALDDLAFAAAQLNATALEAGGCYAALLLDAFDARVPRPYVGVFAGVVRSLEQELPGGLAFAVVTDSDALAIGAAELAAESACHRYLPLAYYCGGERLEQMMLPVAAGPARAGLALPERPVIVATGGARGLTAHLVDVVVEHCRPEAVWLLGSGPVPDPGAAALAALPRAEAIRALMSKHPGESLARLNRRYDDSRNDAERAETLRRLAARCGADRVHYRSCDMLDEGSVACTAEEILAASGRVDVVLHGAGLVRTAVLARKKLDDFRHVRDVKVLGYARLRAAFGDRVGLWASISSVSAFMGRRGEPDYCGGNEFLLLAAAHARLVRARDEVALVSALWVQSGMASADTVGGAFLARQGDIGQMTDHQGRAFFASELAERGSHGLATTWIGDADWATLERTATGYRAACRDRAARAPEPIAAPGAHAGPRRAFLTRPADERSPSAARWTIEIDLAGHPYLLDHLVDDRPTLPGTFILEIGAEAALELAPGHVPSQITDVALSRFIRAPKDRWPRKLQVVARREGERVHVEIATPASGLIGALEHARMTVHVARSLPPGPAGGPPPTNGTPAPNTYQLPGTPVRLAGVFGSLREPRLQAIGGSATLRLTMPPRGGEFTGFVLPSVALDCLLRTAVLDGRRPDEVDVIVPTQVSRIELFTAANDLELARLWSDGISLRHGFDGGTEHCTAYAPDGRPLLRATGIVGAVKATHLARTAQWRA